MLEKDFQQQVMTFARRCGWQVFHFHDSRRVVRTKQGTRIIGDEDAVGFPDLFCSHQSRGMAAIELKTDEKSSRLTRAQREALDRLSESALAMALCPGAPRMRVWVLRPRDFPTLGMALFMEGAGPIVHGF